MDSQSMLAVTKVTRESKWDENREMNEMKLVNQFQQQCKCRKGHKV